MQWSYDPSVDALTIEFDAKRHRSSQTDEVRPGMLLDTDAKGRPLALEFLDASTQFPRALLEALPLPKALLSLNAAADRAGLSAATLRQQIRNGRLNAVKWHGSWWVDAVELRAYLKSRAPQGRPGRLGRRVRSV